MDKVAADLTRILGPERLLWEREHLATYGFDGTAALYAEAGCVALAKTTAEVTQVVRYAAQNKIPVVTRGSGTGLSGGSVPVHGCIVLCLVQMDRVLELDQKNLTIHVESGVVTQKVAELADAAGLLYPPDPGSMKISTIGGNVAENSGGLRGLKYGVTRDYVMGLEVVLANGEAASFGNKCVKDVAGYSMKDVFIGSEGTLGVITKVLLRLVPKPRAKKTLLATFSQMDAAAETVSAIIAAKIIPCTLEFLDRITMKCVEEYAHVGLPLDAEAILLMETDGHSVVVEEEAQQMAEIARNHGARAVQLAQSADEAIQLTTARRVAFSALARVSPTTILEDATVPRSELANMIRFIQQTAAKYEVTVGTFGHMGDGNLHPTFLTNEKNEAEMARVEKAMEEIFDKAVKLGGTITGEHGVGLAKKAFLPRAIGADSLCLMRQLTGCVQDLAFSHVNRDTADALLANGCEVVTPRAQFCCGSIHAHNGEFELAKQQARRNLDAFDLKQLDAVITNAAGCGTHLKNYGHLLQDDPAFAERALEWSTKLRDIHEWLAEIGIRAPAASIPQRVTYHEACHLCHGQKITRQPRQVLKAVPGLELVELPESAWCCGSAGIYNITQPEMSQKLLRRKMANIATTGAEVVASANPGCSVQLQAGVCESNLKLKVAHPISLLAQAYRDAKHASAQQNL